MAMEAAVESEAEVVLVSQEGEELRVPREVACASLLVKEMIEGRQRRARRAQRAFSVAGKDGSNAKKQDTSPLPCAVPLGQTAMTA